MKGTRAKFRGRIPLACAEASTLLLIVPSGTVALAQAQAPGATAYPAKRVRIVVGFCAGRRN